jgi:hypothetical protein
MDPFVVHRALLVMTSGAYVMMIVWLNEVHLAADGIQRHEVAVLGSKRNNQTK